MSSKILGKDFVPESSKNVIVDPGTTIAKLVPGGDDPFHAWVHYHYVCAPGETVVEIRVYTVAVNGAPLGYWVGRWRSDDTPDITNLLQVPDSGPVIIEQRHHLGGVIHITVSTGCEARAVFLTWHGGPDPERRNADELRKLEKSAGKPDITHQPETMANLLALYNAGVDYIEIITR